MGCSFFHKKKFTTIYPKLTQPDTYDYGKQMIQLKKIERNKKETKKQDTTIGNQSMLGQCSEKSDNRSLPHRNCNTNDIAKLNL